MPFFRPKDPFIVGTPHFLGSKFEEILTNTQKEFTKFVNSETIVYHLQPNEVQWLLNTKKTILKNSTTTDIARTRSTIHRN